MTSKTLEVCLKHLKSDLEYCLRYYGSQLKRGCRKIIHNSSFTNQFVIELNLILIQDFPVMYQITMYVYLTIIHTQQAVLYTLSSRLLLALDTSHHQATDKSSKSGKHCIS
jgi:hypothetical protein